MLKLCGASSTALQDLWASSTTSSQKSESSGHSEGSFKHFLEGIGVAEESRVVAPSRRDLTLMLLAQYLSDFIVRGTIMKCGERGFLLRLDSATLQSTTAPVLNTDGLNLCAFCRAEDIPHHMTIMNLPNSCTTETRQLVGKCEIGPSQPQVLNQGSEIHARIKSVNLSSTRIYITLHRANSTDAAALLGQVSLSSSSGLTMTAAAQEAAKEARLGIENMLTSASPTIRATTTATITKEAQTEAASKATKTDPINSIETATSTATSTATPTAAVACVPAQVWESGAFWYDSAQRLAHSLSQQSQLPPNAATTAAAAHAATHDATDTTSKVAVGAACRKRFNDRLLRQQSFHNPHALDTHGG